MNGINGINTRTQLVNRDNELAAILRIGGRYVLVMNDPELAAMAAGQGVRVIYRESGDAPEDSPLAQDPAAFVRKRAEHAPAAYYIHALNEIDPSDEEQRWNREAFKYAKSIGRRLLVGNYATHRSREQWEFARPLLREAAGLDFGIAFHSYLPDGRAEGSLEWLATRIGVGGLWFATEFAYGRYTSDGKQVDPHRGWRGITDAQQRRDFIEKWSAYYSAKNIALLWWCFDWWDQPSVEVAKAEGFGYNDLPDVLDSFATFNKIYTVKDIIVMPDTPTPPEGIRAVVNVRDGIRLRQAPGGVTIRSLPKGEVVTVWEQPATPYGKYVYIPVKTAAGEQGVAAQKVEVDDVWTDTFVPAGEPVAFTLKAPFRKYTITSKFNDVRSYGKHEGIDMVDATAATGVSDPMIHVGATGTVVKVGWDADGYGNYVVVDFGDNWRAIYGHMASVYVGEGQVLKSWEIIGLMGSTGNSTGAHVHVTLQHIGAGLSGYVVSDVVDPAPYIVPALTLAA